MAQITQNILLTPAQTQEALEEYLNKKLNKGSTIKMEVKVDELIRLTNHGLAMKLKVSSK